MPRRSLAESWPSGFRIYRELTASRKPPKTMITCDRCKTENLDGSQYCDECGAPLRPNSPPSDRNDRGLAAGSDGQNGSHAPSPGQRPEFAAGRVSATFNIVSSAKSGAKPHARLV